jgi:lipopolysaccharide transport system permease protein
MQQFPLAPQEIVLSFWRNKYLIKKSIQREVVGRYRGSFLGILWSFVNPMFMLAVYTFVFSVVFKAQWNAVHAVSGSNAGFAGSGSKAEFALILFTGLIVFNLFAECANLAPTLVLINVNYVKKVVFPLEILPWINIGSALFHAMVSFSVWLLAYLIIFGIPHWTILLVPIIFLPLILFIAGISWGLASMGVFFRDLSQFILIVTTSMMFLSPIFYPASNIPAKYQIFLRLNPLATFIKQARDVMLWGRIPDIKMFVFYFFASAAIACLGFAWFQKTRKGFADVL